MLTNLMPFGSADCYCTGQCVPAYCDNIKTALRASCSSCCWCYLPVCKNVALHDLSVVNDWLSYKLCPLERWHRCWPSRQLKPSCSVCRTRCVLPATYSNQSYVACFTSLFKACGFNCLLKPPTRHPEGGVSWGGDYLSTPCCWPSRVEEPQRSPTAP
jgi:hypothetical protein